MLEDGKKMKASAIAKEKEILDLTGLTPNA
jgi:hypothetical protein